MDFTEIARQAGCRPEAAEDIVRRCEARFQGEEPTPDAVQAWIRGTLAEAAPHLFPPAQTLWGRLGMDKATFDQMPPAWRVEQARTHQPQVTAPHPRRPQPYTATAEQVASVEGLSPAEKLTAFRQWRDGQG